MQVATKGVVVGIWFCVTLDHERYFSECHSGQGQHKMWRLLFSQGH